MYGVRRSKRDGHVPFYQCNPSPGIAPYDPNCPHPAVRSERLEAFVLAMIRERLLEAGAEERIREAVLRAKRKHASTASREERRLADLRRKIERGTENLALAEHDDFVAISKLLTKWRAEEAALVERLEQRGRDLEPLPEAHRVLARFAEVPQNLARADRAKLAHAIRQTVSSISIGVRKTQVGEIEFRELHGELVFHEAFGQKPIVIPDEAIGQRRIWREIGESVRRSKQPLHLKDFCQHIGTKDASHAAYHVRRAEKAGLMKKIWHYGGWVAMG